MLRVYDRGADPPKTPLQLTHTAAGHIVNNWPIRCSFFQGSQRKWEDEELVFREKRERKEKEKEKRKKRKRKERKQASKQERKKERRNKKRRTNEGKKKKGIKNSHSIRFSIQTTLPQNCWKVKTRMHRKILFNFPINFFFPLSPFFSPKKVTTFIFFSKGPRFDS